MTNNPHEYLSELPENATQLQLKELWKESYAARRVSWPGTVSNIDDLDDGNISVEVRVLVGERHSLSVLAFIPATRKTDLLRFARHDPVTVSGVLPDEVPRQGYAQAIVLADGSISRQ